MIRFFLYNLINPKDLKFEKCGKIVKYQPKTVKKEWFSQNITPTTF